MPRIIGFESVRPVTPIRGEDGNFTELVPGRVRDYLHLRVLGRSFRLRVPSWALELAF